MSVQTSLAYTTRLLTADDSADFRQLRLTSLQTDPQVYIATFAKLAEQHAEAFATELESYYHPPHFGYWGVFVEDKLQGFYLITRGSSPKMAHTATIQNLYLHPDIRGHQLGATELTARENYLREHTDLELLYLEVFSSNMPARRLYLQLGYQRCGSKKHAIKTLENGQTQYDDLLFLVKFL